MRVWPAVLVSLSIAAIASSEAADMVSALRNVLARSEARRPITGFKYAQVDLNGDGILDAIVLLTGDFCGSGGCRMIILKGDGKSFSVVNNSTISREPIGVLAQSKFGWHSLTVTVGGGGLSGDTRVLTFNGNGYPFNPSVAPRATQEQRRATSVLEMHSVK
jgi:putative lipoprotein